MPPPCLSFTHTLSHTPSLTHPLSFSWQDIFTRLYGGAPTLAQVAEARTLADLKAGKLGPGAARAAALAAKELAASKAKALPDPEPCLVVCLPDATMTLDSLSSALAPLCAANKDLGLLLLAPPGAPNTVWPKAGQPCDSTLAAAALGSLIANLATPATGAVKPSAASSAASSGPESGSASGSASGPGGSVGGGSTSVKGGGLDTAKARRFRARYCRPDVPVFWLGFGNGGHTLLALSVGPLRRDPRLAGLKAQTVVLLIANGFAFSDPSVKEASRALQRVLVEGSPAQR